MIGDLNVRLISSFTKKYTLSWRKFTGMPLSLLTGAFTKLLGNLLHSVNFISRWIFREKTYAA